MRNPCLDYLSTSIIMVCILLLQCSQYIVLHPAVAQFVTRLCITYREQGSDLDTLQADVECDKSVPVPN